MVDALSSAANGLLNAQRRATDLAVEILKTTSDQSSFQEETEAATAEQDANAQNDSPDTRQEQGRPLAQQIVDLKGAEAQFKASAAAFTRVAESQDQLLGRLFDDES
ncbi:MAG: hypothetical protein JJ850_17215 [Kordiimonadaceae bacterium]|nr:hypothetical protein [Kordiimonadaceae bacterium]MBO6570516.1 hypothetical protein [Kordiimonadaceae bacterium]MBO6966365.1 hypothetical protein [Kordiimonadaceae bacterium]